MTLRVVSRHSGALDWLQKNGVAADEVVGHLEMDDVHEGDVILGTLPLNLAAEICAKGARAVHLSLDLPAHLRGLELTAEQLDECNARLREYRVIDLGEFSKHGGAEE